MCTPGSNYLWISNPILRLDPRSLCSVPSRLYLYDPWHWVLDS